ncbi:MAG: DUF2085 domain-containing protein [Archangium sp.]|nr:DUF2085 domain-containing protein [Archangium sp.]
MFWLSHHPAEELDRCYRLGGVHVCARCLGTYPVMFAAIALQLKLRFPLEHPLDFIAVIALTLPATIDWAIGRFRPHRFSNPWRTATGVLLGLALGRTVFIHLQHPFPPVFLAQGIVVTVVALPVILASYRRKPRR